MRGRPPRGRGLTPRGWGMQRPSDRMRQRQQFNPTRIMQQVDAMVRRMNAARLAGRTPIRGYEALLNPESLGIESYNEALRRSKTRDNSDSEHNPYDEDLLPINQPRYF